MPQCTCECGAKYKFTEASLGKRAKCQKCGVVFTLASDHGDIAIAEDPAVSTEPEANSPAAGPFGGRGLPAERRATVPPPIAPTRTYLGDVLSTFLFPATLDNFITFVVVAVSITILMPLARFTPFAGGLVWLVVVGWYAAFRFEIVRSAAAGEERLPNVNVTNDLWGDLVAPFCGWVGSWGIVFLPAIAFMFYAVSQGTIDADDAAAFLAGGVMGMLQVPGAGMVGFAVLVWLGLCLWPIVALCVAIDGFGSLARPDLIVLTIVRTLPGYSVTLVMMVGAVALQKLLADAIGGTLTGGGVAIGSGIAQYAIVSVVGVYFDIVLMRLIGLYYHHFKPGFAWDWE